MLTQFKAAFKLVDHEFKNAEEFVKKYKLDCPLALTRIKEERPITIKDDKGNTSKCIADIVSVSLNANMKSYYIFIQLYLYSYSKLFITLMDKLRLNIRANDELQPG